MCFSFHLYDGSIRRDRMGEASGAEDRSQQIALNLIPRRRPDRTAGRRISIVLSAMRASNLCILGCHLFQERRKGLPAVLAQNFNCWFAHSLSSGPEVSTLDAATTLANSDISTTLTVSTG